MVCMQMLSVSACLVVRLLGYNQLSACLVTSASTLSACCQAWSQPAGSMLLGVNTGAENAAH